MKNKKNTKILATSQHIGSAQAIVGVVKLALNSDNIDIECIGYQQSMEIFSKEGIPHKILDVELISPNSLTGELYEKLENILMYEDPDIVLTGSSNPSRKGSYTLEQILCVLCRKKCIPMVMVLDYWGFYKERFDGIPYGGTWTFLPDRICVMDSLAANDLIDLGIPQDRISITGNPHFDKWAVNSKYTPSIIDSVNKPIEIIYQSQPILEDQVPQEIDRSASYSQHSAIFDIVKVLKETDIDYLDLYIRLHPRDNQKMWNKTLSKLLVMKNSGFRISLVNNQNDKFYLQNYDFVISHFSTLIFEALHLGLPCISYQPSSRTSDSLITNRLGLSLAAYDLETLKESIKKAIDPHYRETLAEKFQT